MWRWTRSPYCSLSWSAGRLERRMRLLRLLRYAGIEWWPSGLYHTWGQHTHTHAHTHTNMHMYMHAHMHTYTHTHTYIKTHTHTNTHTNTRMQGQTQLHKHAHTNKSVNAYTISSEPVKTHKQRVLQSVCFCGKAKNQNKYINKIYFHTLTVWSAAVNNANLAATLTTEPRLSIWTTGPLRWCLHPRKITIYWAGPTPTRLWPKARVWRVGLPWPGCGL